MITKIKNIISSKEPHEIAWAVLVFVGWSLMIIWIFANDPIGLGLLNIVFGIGMYISGLFFMTMNSIMNSIKWVFITMFFTTIALIVEVIILSLLNIDPGLVWPTELS